MKQIGDIFVILVHKINLIGSLYEKFRLTDIRTIVRNYVLYHSEHL